MINEASDVFRIVNMVLALAALVLLIREVHPRRHNMSARLLLLAQALGVMLFVVVEGSIESLKQDLPLGFRVPLTTAATIWVIVAMLFTPSDYDKDRRGR